MSTVPVLPVKLCPVCGSSSVCKQGSFWFCPACRWKFLVCDSRQLRKAPERKKR